MEAEKEMNDLELIKNLLEKPIAFHRAFYHVTQDVKAALFLSQLYYWSKIKDFDWVYKESLEWEDETGLSWKEQKRIRKLLNKLSLIEEVVKAYPGKRSGGVVYFKFNFDTFILLAKKYYSNNLPKGDRCEHLENANDLPSVDRPKGDPNDRPKGDRLYNETENTNTENTIRDNTNVLSCPATPDSSKKNVSIPYQEIVDYLNQSCGTHYRADNKETQRHIRLRWKDGFTLDDFKKVIDNMASKWLGDDKMSSYLRPSTLYSNKFESYLNTPQRKNIYTLD
jgi:uncharacterized phage protein (TIGR02220 family)